MFSKILIANRGEIACRIFRTAQRMGVACVAVYSDADARALHVSLADEAYRIGPALAAESYLDIAAIIAAAKRAGAEAVHPGYGFLSENAAFAEACEAAGLVFIGPPPAAIRAMGLKDEAKRLMQRAGVPVVPGYQGDSQDAKVLAAEAKRIGFPVLIKAVAGGGGKGIRRVDRADELAVALETAQREAKSSFGDGRVLIEKYLTKARHIEVQVFADAHGNAVHLFERDCSMQRRHQKVIEEAPAPGMTPELRVAMGKAAVEAARAVSYRGAGTVEFIADATDGLQADCFYFMEMNTRLQVEHPITEAITGQDLVEWQLRVAAGERLPVLQDDLAIAGHAFEARVYAEDPEHDFRPAPGRIAEIILPEHLARIDTGIQDGDEITPFYDPMIAKVIVHGADRAAALGKLTRALEASSISGVANNLGFLARLSRHGDVASGNVDTGLIGRSMDMLAADAPPTARLIAIAALAVLKQLDRPKSKDPWATLSGWRAWGQAEQSVELLWRDQLFRVPVRWRGERRFDVETHAGPVAVDASAMNGSDGHLVIDGRKVTPSVSEHPGGIDVLLAGGERASFRLPDTVGGDFGEDEAEDRLVSPMPGVVKLLNAGPGAKVAKGDRLAVVEAMKTEYALSAPRDGVVASVAVAVGDTVTAGAVLLQLEAQAHG